jgi:hypothetical protein
MKTLELKDISGYSQYGLAIQQKDKIIIVYGAYLNRHEYSLWSPCDFYYLNQTDKYYTDYCKPILRPLSDIYKPIIHNGEEIIPIIYFAKHILGDKIHGYNQNYRNLHWIIFEHENLLSKYEVQSEYFPERIQTHSCFVYINGYNRTNKHSYWRNCREYKTDVVFIDYLNELKIDYRGLINEGLAIDANKLEINPYK